MSTALPTDYAARVMKVNHAGENGAIHIYTGQLLAARMTAPGMRAELAEFRSRHLEHQLQLLEGRHEAAAAAVREIAEEERRHHDQSAAHVAGDRGIWPRVLTPLVSASTEAVIWIGMRL